MYKCLECKRVLIKKDEKIRCPFCGGRIFVKIRPEVLKKVSTG